MGVSSDRPEGPKFKARVREGGDQIAGSSERRRCGTNGVVDEWK